MIQLLLRIIFISALFHSIAGSIDPKTCLKGRCQEIIERNRDRFLEINWKPISIFKEEAKRFD